MKQEDLNVTSTMGFEHLYLIFKDRLVSIKCGPKMQQSPPEIVGIWKSLEFGIDFN